MKTLVRQTKSNEDVNSGQQDDVCRLEVATRMWRIESSFLCTFNAESEARNEVRERLSTV